jgi:FHS family L-fucose permease-like MFS transporter
MWTAMKSFLEMFRVNGRNYAITFALVSTLFFLWGLCNGMLETMNKHFKDSFHINYMESAMVQFAGYTGYFVMAIPAGLLARRFGYKGGILIGLALIITGALWFIPATKIATFSAFLAGLFIVATGLTVLETIANPYTTVLGPAQTGATRINLAQTCNAVGAIVGPLIGGHFLLSTTAVANSSNDNLFVPYLGIACVVAILAVFFARAELPDVQPQDESVGDEVTTAVPSEGKPLWRRWHFTLAVAAQFFYVAAQAGIWNFFVSYVTSPEMPHLGDWLVRQLPAWMTVYQNGSYRISDGGAPFLLSFGGMALFLIGRFSGSLMLKLFSAHRTLAVYGACNTVMMLLVVLSLGWVSVAALFISFFFMSIMYPTIFALGIRGLGNHTKLGSSLIVMAIVGGALMPILMGWLADLFSMRVGFAMPLFCFAFVMFYAAAWPALERLDTGHDVAD